jgi:precorrin-2 C20-methyltransferase / precorrin-3B C17-methyltransferase
VTGARFYGIGLGPGDPELITRKAARIIGEADVIAYHAGVNKQSYARTIAASLIPDDAIEEELRYPLTTGTTDHPGGYAGALAEFYEESAARLAAHLHAGRTVALLAEGDPLFYGSFMYMHDRLSARFATEIIPGIPAFTAATAAVACPLVRQTDVLTVLPGTLPEAELARRLADTDGAIIMKLGRTFPAVRRALALAGRLGHAMYVERASHPEQRWMPVADVDESSVPYLSLIVVNGDSINGPRSRVMVEEPNPATVSTGPAVAELLVVGLGPGPDGWLTPEAAAALAEVQHVVGYAPYVARVPQREDLQRHASGNTVEVDRARFALDLALRG